MTFPAWFDFARDSTMLPPPSGVSERSEGQ